jgi:protein TonB
MKQSAVLYSKRDQAAGFAAALILHTVVLYGLWSYHIIPPPSEVLTVFVSNLNPLSPTRIDEPLAPKPPQPAPEIREAPRTVTPSAPPILTSPAPVTSPAEPATPPPPVVKSVPAPLPVSSPVVSRLQPQQGATAAPQPMLLSGELSVSCTERTPPVYPKQSLRLGEQGKSVLLVELDELGRVANITVKTTSGFPRLDEAAINAVKTWHCTPAKRNGVTVRSVALQPFNFALKGR